MRRFHQKDVQKRQNVFKIHRFHQNDVQKRQNVLKMRRFHQNDVQKRQNVVKMRQNDVQKALSSPRCQQATMEKRWLTSTYDGKTRVIFKEKEACRIFYMARNR